MQSQSTGVLEVYDIQNNTITGASQLGTVGTDWKFSGLGNFNGDGTADLLLRKDQTSGLQVYNIKDDKIVGTALLGTIGRSRAGRRHASSRRMAGLTGFSFGRKEMKGDPCAHFWLVLL